MKMLVVGLISLSMFLTACGRENPLMQEDIIKRIRANFFLDASNYPIKLCAKFYSGSETKNEKTTCDDWTKGFYERSMKVGTFPKNTVVEDLRDSKLWQQVLAIGK